MGAFYADEQFPLRTTQHLRVLGHDVQTVQDARQDNRRISDDEVLAFFPLVPAQSTRPSARRPCCSLQKNVSYG